MADNIDIKTPSDVLTLGLGFVGIPRCEQQRKTHKQLLALFHDHYGCLPVDLSLMWSDLQTTNVENAKLKPEEKMPKAFKMFMAANFLLWAHPKNASIFASRFKICKRYIQSNKHLWKWVFKMSALLEDKVVWDEATLSDNDYAIFIGSVDGVDFNIWEKPSNRYNIDKGFMSYKSRHGAYRYLVAVSVWDSKCIYVHGPVKAGEVVDLDLFRLDLKAKMRALPGKMLVGDRGFQTSEPDEVGIIAVPNPRDSRELATFKTRVRQRHESFNCRLKHYKILQDVFRFAIDKHEHVVRAVVTRVQYAMDSGSPLFDP